MADVTSENTARRPQDRWKIGTLLLWLVPQLMILCLSLGHVPLWFAGPVRMDNLVLPQLLVIQILVASMLFPLLLRSWTATAVIILSVWPLIQLGAIVSGIPAPQWMAAALYLSLFILGLRMWAVCLPGGYSDLIAVGLITGWILGGVMMVYLSAEFLSNAPPSTLWQRAALWNPLIGLLTQLSEHPNPIAWIIPSGMILSGLSATLIRCAGRRRRKNHIPVI